MLVSASFFIFGPMKTTVAFYQGYFSANRLTNSVKHLLCHSLVRSKFYSAISKTVVFIACTLCLSASIFAEKKYNFDATCQQAYSAITSLKINTGRQLIAEARKQDPDNLIPDMLEGYINFFVLFFNEDPADYKILKPKYDDILERLADGPDNTPFYRFARGAELLQRATIEIKFGERWSSAWDMRKAFSLIKENQKKYPNFVLNNMIYGPMNIAAGIIPDGYKWLAGIFGIRGSVHEGMRLMQQFLNSNDTWARLFSNEASFYYCYTKFYIENKPEEVFQYISQRKLDLVNNHLLAYMAANLGVNAKHTDFAKHVIENRNPSAEYMQTPVWDLEMGYVRIHHLELDEAIKSFNNFVTNFKGNFYKKDAYEKLSWAYYLSGNKAAADKTRQQLLKKGNTDSDADKQAQKDAKSGIWPNVLLLKTRLLSDGGYNAEALALIVGMSSSDFSLPEEKLEFSYRLARIYDDMGRDDEAIKTYLVAINLGQNRQEYYASRAALQIGYIYEKRGQKSMAIAYYQKCLDMDDHDYKDSIDQKAKAGIARCKGE
jgi:tetratricopeptide (TPR) repeat protein